MKKSILFLAFSFLISTLSAQVAISRILTVKEGQQEKFMKLAAEKTQKFNSKSGQPAYYTFSIETGPDAGKLWRVQVEDEMSDFDTIDKVGNDYWQSTVGKMHATANTQHWWRNKGTSYEAAKGYHDDMVMNLVLFSWFITTEYFYHLTDSQVKDLLYSEQQKMIEDDMLPAGVFGSVKDETESFVDTEGDRWFVST